MSGLSGWTLVAKLYDIDSPRLSIRLTFLIESFLSFIFISTLLSIETLIDPDFPFPTEVVYPNE